MNSWPYGCNIFYNLDADDDSNLTWQRVRLQKFIWLSIGAGIGGAAPQATTFDDMASVAQKAAQESSINTKGASDGASPGGKGPSGAGKTGTGNTNKGKSAPSGKNEIAM
jgi:hypothetical protein